MTPEDMAATHAAAFTQSRPWTQDEFAALLESPHCFVHGTPQCFALVRVVADEAELLTIATHPDHQRCGLARNCMSNWMATACGKGAKTAFLEVAADNDPAISLYQSLGFEATGQRRGYYPREHGPAVDAIVMQRPLDHP